MRGSCNALTFVLRPWALIYVLVVHGSLHPGLVMLVWHGFVMQCFNLFNYLIYQLYHVLSIYYALSYLCCFHFGL